MARKTTSAVIKEEMVNYIGPIFKELIDKTDKLEGLINSKTHKLEVLLNFESHRLEGLINSKTHKLEVLLNSESHRLEDLINSKTHKLQVLMEDMNTKINVALDVSKDVTANNIAIKDHEERIADLETDITTVKTVLIELKNR